MSDSCKFTKRMYETMAEWCQEKDKNCWLLSQDIPSKPKSSGRWMGMCVTCPIPTLCIECGETYWKEAVLRLPKEEARTFKRLYKKVLQQKRSQRMRAQIVGGSTCEQDN